jgi:hypothetical protein
VLLCYENILNTELKFFFEDKQIDIISNQINSLILQFAGVSNESILEKVFKQQKLADYTYRLMKNCIGDRISLKI